jgi:cytochrome P450
VYGHTFLFQKLAGGCAALFNPEQTEIAVLPPFFFNRKLGKCFALYVWGQWRVCIQGEALSRKVLEMSNLVDAFPWTPPIMLLGKCCLPFLDENDAEQLRALVEPTLSHRSVAPYAAVFAEMAERTLNRIRAGDDFERHHSLRRWKNAKKATTKATTATMFQDDSELNVSYASTDGDRRSDDQSDLGDAPFEYRKVRWEALRSYTFDLIDGPVLGTNNWRKRSQQTVGESTCSEAGRNDSAAEEDTDLPTRERMILWMERIKHGVDVIKLTFGPEWMHVWRANEYGRALNARMHVHDVMHQHVRDMTQRVPVHHRAGHGYHDPSTQPIPLLTLRGNYQRDREGIFGTPSLVRTSIELSRPRANSAPSAAMCLDDRAAEAIVDDQILGAKKKNATSDLVSPFGTEQDLARPKYESSPALRNRKVPATPFESPSARSFRDQLEHPPAPRSVEQNKKQNRITQISIFERLMRQQDRNGNGISQAVLSELAVMLWMMMDVANAWTSMALVLLATDNDACQLVHEELDELILDYGQDDLFQPSVLGKMKYLDALLYEAIRLCPSFLAGLKKTTATVELKELGVQLPKNTHIFFCEPTVSVFNIAKAYGRKPEELGKVYPCVEL